jgi:hypothetical protein
MLNGCKHCCTHPRTKNHDFRPKHPLMTRAAGHPSLKLSLGCFSFGVAETTSRISSPRDGVSGTYKLIKKVLAQIFIVSLSGGMYGTRTPVGHC